MQTGQLLMGYFDELDLLKCDESGKSAIHYACEKGYHKILKLLLQTYESNNDISELINLRANATYNRTPLMYACFNGHFECVRILLQYKELNLNLLDTDGTNCLFLAFHRCGNAISKYQYTSMKNFPELENILVSVWNDKRYNKKQKDPHQKTVLMWSVVIEADRLMDCIMHELVKVNQMQDSKEFRVLFFVGLCSLKCTDALKLAYKHCTVSLGVDE